VELRHYCRGWPTDVVKSAILSVLRGDEEAGRETEALAVLVAAWLTNDDSSEPPPLNTGTVRCIWEILSRGCH